MGVIYMIKNKINGKIYIGQTIRSVEKRFKRHQRKSSECPAISAAIKKHGWENFEKDWYECPDEDLNFDEELLVRELNTMVPHGYNLKEGGGNGKPSDETKQKISESLTGEKNPNFGIPMSEEQKQKIREAQTGKTHNEESRRKISEAQLGEKNHMFGKTPSDETRQKMSEARTGKPVSEEQKRKISESTLGEKNHAAKRVYQYDLDGTYIDAFGSNEEAARHLKKKDGTNISKCATGKLKTAYGFTWSYMKY